MPAWAQTADTVVETVVVTGSRIPQQGIYSSSPVTAVSQQEMKFEGTTDVTTLIDTLPEAFADQSSKVLNGATGTSNANLRGLGSKRTLVAVDGTRLMPGDPLDPVADLNQIPAALVDHIDVLAGGASAVYGSDALAGVINFVMRKDFEGIELDGTYSIDEAGDNNSVQRARIAAAGYAQAPENVWDGATADATLILGSTTANGKGNVSTYLGYRDVQPALLRDFSECPLKTTFTRFDPDDPLHTGLVCTGSSTYNQWLSIDNSVNGSPSDFFETGNGMPGSGRFVPFTGVPGQRYNYGAFNYQQRPDTRYIGGFFAHYDVNKEFGVYSSFMFSDDHTRAPIAPSGLFFGVGTISGALVEVNCSNPLMTSQERTTLCGADGSGASNLIPGQSLLLIGRRAIEAPNRFDDLRHTALRMQIGAKGDLGAGWSYDVYAQYGLTLYNEFYENDFSVSHVQNALEVDPATGNCFAAEPNAQGIVADPSCVPLDVFNGFGSIKPAMLKYITAQGFKEGYTQEQIVSGSMNGDLGASGGRSPLAKDPIAGSIGAEWRSEALQLRTDREFQTGDLYSNGGSTPPVPLSGFDVAEGFGEVNIPLIQGRAFVEDMSLNAAYRYSSYNTAGATSTYKYGAQWQPVDDLRLRASYERAARAPNVLELFTPEATDFFQVSDPCATSTSGRCADVVNAGTARLVCPDGACAEQTGGNVRLRPETGDTRTVGVVLTPSFFDGFSATVDYFDIKVSGFISSVSSVITLDGCYGADATAATEAFFCPLVHRNAQGQLYGGGYVSAQTTNTGFLSTRGVDVEANYTSNMDDWGLTGAGSLDVNLVGTYLESLVTESLPGLQTYDCAGLFGVICGEPAPRWRHKLRLTWSSIRDFKLSLDWRHDSSVRLDANTNNPMLNSACSGPCGDVPDNHISSFDYFDVSTDWTVRQGVELRAGVNNLFDREPPAMDSFELGVAGDTNTYPGTYDTLGRTIFVGATIKY
jgi:iron complex outermembrane receptor protein